jgi:hypothetical protein
VKLYVANLTMQRHEFLFRVSEQPNKLQSRIIPVGGQEIVWTADSLDPLNEIVAQYERYGMVPVRSLSRQQVFTGLAWSIDKPINVEAILAANEANLKAQAANARQERINATASAAHFAAAQARTDGKTAPRSFSIEVQEAPANPNDTPSISEIIDVPITGAPRRAKAPWYRAARS